MIFIMTSFRGTIMPGSYDTAVLEDLKINFDSLKISWPNFIQISTLYIVVFIHENKQTYMYQCDYLTVIWHYRVRETRFLWYRGIHKISAWDGLMPLKFWKNAVIMFNITSALNWQKINKKQPFWYNEMKRFKCRSTNSTKIKKRRAKMQNFQLM
jgi:hypothetical protein